VFSSCRPIGTYGTTSEGFFHSIRLKPNEDIHDALRDLVAQRFISAANIISASGSVREASIRYANQTNFSYLKGPLEVVSLTGTMSINGNQSIWQSRIRWVGPLVVTSNLDAKVFFVTKCSVHNDGDLNDRNEVS
jgi:hypothetical protein